MAGEIQLAARQALARNMGGVCRAGGCRPGAATQLATAGRAARG